MWILELTLSLSLRKHHLEFSSNLPMINWLIDIVHQPTQLLLLTTFIIMSCNVRQTCTESPINSIPTWLRKKDGCSIAICAAPVSSSQLSHSAHIGLGTRGGSGQWAPRWGGYQLHTSLPWPGRRNGNNETPCTSAGGHLQSLQNSAKLC